MKNNDYHTFFKTKILPYREVNKYSFRKIATLCQDCDFVINSLYLLWLKDKNSIQQKKIIIYMLSLSRQDFYSRIELYMRNSYEKYLAHSYIKIRFTLLQYFLF